VLAPRPTEVGGGPAGVVESPAKRLGTGVVEPAVDVEGGLAGVSNWIFGGADEVLLSGFD
jgi:hypothetical protein